MMRCIVIAGALLFWSCLSAFATDQGIVVSSCGTASYIAGQFGLMTVDTTGRLCDTATANQGTPAAPSNAWPVAPQSYPSGATPITASTTGTTTAFSVSLPATAGKMTYICGFMIGAQATAATSGLTFISNTVSNSINFLQPIAAAPAVGVLTQLFNPCIPASGNNTVINVFSAAPGAGGSAAITAWGYQQ